MNAEQMERVFGRGRVQMVTGAHVEVFREALVPGERRRYTKRFLETEDADFRQWTDREWRILARLIGHGVRCVPDVVQYHGDARGGVRQLQTYDAGITVDQWATLLPVARDGVVRRHVFEDCAHWWALAHHCLAALDEVHALHVVHLDIKADNICIPLGPPTFDPDSDDDRLHVAFSRLALIDFAFSLVSHETLTTALPIGWQKDYDYQSPRLLAALEVGRAGDLVATQELDWRCDLYSLAAMLRRYLKDDVADEDDGGWTRQRCDDARAFVYRLRDCHDSELASRRPHRELMELTAAQIGAPDLARSLAAGWTLARAPVPAVQARWVTPLTRIILPNAAATHATAVRIPTVVVPAVAPSVFRNPRPLPAVSRSDIDMHAAAAPPRPRPRAAPIAGAVGALAAMAALLVVAEPSLVDKVLASFAQLRTEQRADATQVRAQSAAGERLARTDATPNPGNDGRSRVPQTGKSSADLPDATRSAEQDASSAIASKPDAPRNAETKADAAEAGETPESTTGPDAAASANADDARQAEAQESPAKSAVAPIAPEHSVATNPAPSASVAASPSPAASQRAESRASRSVQRSTSPIIADRRTARSAVAAASAAQPGVSAGVVAAAPAAPRTTPASATVPSLPAPAVAATPSAPAYDAKAARIATANLTAQATRVESPRSTGDKPTSVAIVAPAPVPTPAASAPSPVAEVAAATTREHQGTSVSAAPDHGANRPTTLATESRRAATPSPRGAAMVQPSSSRDPLRASIESVLRAFGLTSTQAAPVEERSTAQRSANAAQGTVVDAPRSAQTNRVASAEAPRVAAGPPSAPPPEPVRTAPLAATPPPRPSLAYPNAPPPPPARVPESPRDSLYSSNTRLSSEAPTGSPPLDAPPLVQPARAAVTPPPPVGAPADSESDLGARARRMLAGSVPSVAAQARLDAANVLSMASVPDRPLQRRYLIEAVQVPWRSERAYVSTIDSNEARYLHDAARQSLASGRKADALELQLRAFAANPRDADVAGFLAYLHLEQSPSQPETARQLALHALAMSGYRRSVRYEDWNTFAVASALTGREADAMRAFMVELGLSGDAERTCRAALRAYAVHGERLRAPVEALLQRIRSVPEPPPCAGMKFRLAAW